MFFFFRKDVANIYRDAVGVCNWKYTFVCYFEIEDIFLKFILIFIYLFFIGDLCFSCNEGYTGGPSIFTCNEDGVWEGELSCVGRECGRQVAVTLLPPNMTARCQGDTSFGGDDCKATCDNGFEGEPVVYKYFYFFISCALRRNWCYRFCHQ